MTADLNASPERPPGTAPCSWCGALVERDDGFRLGEPARERRATFCRLEHVVPWAIEGPHWEAGPLEEPPSVLGTLEACAHCGGELPDTRVVLVRHRGEYRIGDGFCSVDHLARWAGAGGRWR